MTSTILFVVSCAVALVWVYLFWRTRRALAAAVRPALDAQPAACPLVSILVAARNEADRALEAALNSLVAQDYAPLEIIVVDDNSTDTTPVRLAELAAAHPARLRVLRGDEPPPGWLGKPYALEQARQAARGELLLATDADIIHHPASVRAGVALLEERRLDALTLFPRLELETFWERTVLPVIAWMMIVSSPFDRANDPASDVSLGCGSFVLVRRPALEALGGYAAVKQQVNEDGWTMRLLKRRGFRTAAGDGSAFLRTRLYRSLGEIWAGFGKSMFPAVNFSVARALWALAASWLLGPFALGAVLCALLSAAAGNLRPWHAAAALAWMGMTATALLFLRQLSVPSAYALLAGVGHLLASLVLLQSTWKISTGRGVTWKGRRLYAARAAAGG